ncbi:MAG: 23S rRNA (adenine2503-C2)-methyltransferase [Gammaproteobacteria bacterium]
MSNPETRIKLAALSAPKGAGPHPHNLLGMPRQDLEAFFADLGEKPFRAEQIIKWVHQWGCTDFGSMSNLSRKLRAQLQEIAQIRAPVVEKHQRSADGTQKWLLRVDAGNCIETVFIPEPGRGTLCVSSQVGCALNCSFCATAQQGFNRNLSAAEIIGQVWLAKQSLAQEQAAKENGGLEAKCAVPNGVGRSVLRPSAITNVVLMGMGEPLLNFDEVTRAIDLMLEDCAYNLGRRRVTLSTAGVVPGIARLAERCPVSLAVSLHATTNELRDQLVPINRKYPIEVLMEACRDYAHANPKGQITFEYVMLNGINDSDDDARRLLRLMRQVPSKVNLIPFNPFPGVPYTRPEQTRIDAFREIVMRGGIITTTRRPRGDDIDAACGQLAGQVVARGRSARQRSHIQDIPVAVV